MKNSKLAPVAFLALLALMLLLSGASNAQTAVADVDETIMFDYIKDKYVSSKDGDVENPYTTASIYEKHNQEDITFRMNMEDGTQEVAEYKIVDRKKNSKLIIAKRTSDGSPILIKQTRNKLTVHCEYNYVSERYDGTIVFTKLKFKHTSY